MHILIVRKTKYFYIESKGCHSLLRVYPSDEARLVHSKENDELRSIYDMTKNPIIPDEVVMNKILFIRGQKVAKTYPAREIGFKHKKDHSL